MKIQSAIVVVIILVPLLLLASDASAQQKKQSLGKHELVESFVENEIPDIVEATAGLYEARYLDVAIGKKMAERLRKQLKAGAFDSVASRTELAAMLQRELRLVQEDKHIQIDFRLAPKSNTKKMALPSVPKGLPAKREMRQRKKVTSESPPRRTGIRKVQMLEGGVACVRIASFTEADLEAGLYDAAMRLVAKSDAVIVDLRGNGGGSSRAANELMTSFLGPDRIHVGTTRFRQGSREQWTNPRADQTFVDKTPLFILVDKMSGSAAEAVSYHLKHLGRATIVGEGSYGAANLSATISLEVWNEGETELIGSYTLILPKAQTVNSKSGRSWEGVGVVPDVVTVSQKAMGEAHVLAIEAAHPSAPWAESLVTSVRAMYDPVNVTTAQLERLAGSYERGRSYRTEQGKFFTRSGTGAEMELIPITATSYRYKSGISATVHFDVHANGTVEAARIVFSDGGTERFARLD